MALATLNDVYIDQLRDLSSANTQAMEMTRRLAETAEDERLRDALSDGVEGIARGLDTVSRLLEGHGFDTQADFCKGMEGLCAEAEAHALNAPFGSRLAQDAMIAAQYQRMTLYAMAGYANCLALASRLDLMEDARKLELCLDATRRGHQEMQDLTARTLRAAA
ncbi:MAG: DUF892 family protein [Paracoccaceae bacterium]